VSEYRTPEEDTIGRDAGEDDESEGGGPPADGGEKRAGEPRRDEQAAETRDA
jgi:hypothetical protein